MSHVFNVTVLVVTKQQSQLVPVEVILQRGIESDRDVDCLKQLAEAKALYKLLPIPPAHEREDWQRVMTSLPDLVGMQVTTWQIRRPEDG